jgi:chemotaxis receptor (MCP) glutamine deamidase CheD
MDSLAFLRRSAVGSSARSVFAPLHRRLLRSMPKQGNLAAVKERLSAALTAGSSFFATQALDIGWSTASFIVSLLVMFYPAVLFCA